MTSEEYEWQQELTLTAAVKASVTCGFGLSIKRILSDSLKDMAKKYFWTGGPGLNINVSLSQPFLERSVEKAKCQPTAAKACNTWIKSRLEGTASAPLPYPIR